NQSAVSQSKAEHRIVDKRLWINEEGEDAHQGETAVTVTPRIRKNNARKQDDEDQSRATAVTSSNTEAAMERRPPEPKLMEPEGESKPEITRLRSTPTKQTNQLEQQEPETSHAASRSTGSAKRESPLSTRLDTKTEEGTTDLHHPELEETPENFTRPEPETYRREKVKGETMAKRKRGRVRRSASGGGTLTTDTGARRNGGLGAREKNIGGERRKVYL
ncbi:unnamed protein product, partial [Brassica oleracea var. botrytis]